MRCARRLIPSAEWMAADQEQRNTWKAERWARSCRADMCTACHQWLRVRNQLDRYATQRNRKPAETDAVNPWTRCRRCGHEERHTGDLCADCVEVTAAMREREIWVTV